MEFVRDSDNGAGLSNQKSMIKSLHEEVEVVFHYSFNQVQEEGASVSSPMCTQKTEFFHEALGIKGEFCACFGWLTRFKQHYSIFEIAMQGERLSASDAVV
jgi:hypothetical protein